MKGIKRISLPATLLVAGIFVLSGFDRPGAHSFQVFVDDDLVLEKYVDSKMAAARLPLETASHKTLTIRYSECGRTVDGRKLTIMDKENKELKAWRFDGATAGLRDPMTVDLKEISALAKEGSNELKVSYSSKDVPDGIHILTLVTGSATKASLK